MQTPDSDGQGDAQALLHALTREIPPELRTTPSELVYSLCYVLARLALIDHGRTPDQVRADIAALRPEAFECDDESLRERFELITQGAVEDAIANATTPAV